MVFNRSGETERAMFELIFPHSGVGVVLSGEVEGVVTKCSILFSLNSTLVSLNGTLLSLLIAQVACG